ncbi:hydroxymethylglutaryl-CoA synthase family protein [Paenibacillus alvei]|uniref:Acetyl-S-AcpK beta-ketothioester bacillaene intermediate transferase n=1 Tax=Paenibacillus alvei TaxID=44250 RepID=A0A383RF06_PAEAL|nr:hydroxymethylglutaryl-CoA synthase family protein [Paenibacillus alvei]SYX85251.1 acetyl-S-AcpK beta-ketothioester bacillaene intermediate transferase [Paenibacillus alvei]
MKVGIEAINFFGGSACIDVRSIFEKRGLDSGRYDNLMLDAKSVAIPCEDPVTYAVNAAKPLVDRLSDKEKKMIDLLITTTESGIDFGKSISTYVHDYLTLSNNCRVFELKQACYGGTAALQMAASYIVASCFPGRKALVIATDMAKLSEDMDYFEASQGVGAVAMLISDRPDIMELDLGASGYYSFEVMDTCRPLPDMETGDSDLSLLSYLDCFEQCFRDYEAKVEKVDFMTTFDSLAFHTPFGGMVKGAHRKLMRELYRATSEEIECDFQTRVMPSLTYCSKVGNVYSASLYLSLCGLIEYTAIHEEKRIGLFSYGSGCSSEFFSGLVGPGSKQKLMEMNIEQLLSKRHKLSIDEYERLLLLNKEIPFGTRNHRVAFDDFNTIYSHFYRGSGFLILYEINEYHREYRWS